MRRTLWLSYGICAILPFCLGVFSFLIGFGHPNLNFPKMADDLSWFCLAALGFFVATFFITAISLPRFQIRLSGIWAHLVWLATMAVCAIIILALLSIGTNTNGFLD